MARRKFLSVACCCLTRLGRSPAEAKACGVPRPCSEAWTIMKSTVQIDERNMHRRDTPFLICCRSRSLSSIVTMEGKCLWWSSPRIAYSFCLYIGLRSGILQDSKSGSGVRAGRLLGKPRLHKRLDDAVLVLVAGVHLLVDGGHIVQSDPGSL
jgi:hypothetical protein